MEGINYCFTTIILQNQICLKITLSFKDCQKSSIIRGDLLLLKAKPPHRDDSVCNTAKICVKYFCFVIIWLIWSQHYGVIFPTCAVANIAELSSRRILMLNF